jgi:DNA-binding winged helix-turn-helix (wHTH) protein
MEQRQIVFPPFQLDRVNEQVWHSTARGVSALHLRPKTFAVLCYLAERAQQLVTKDQLLDAIWSETCVTDSALKSCIRELREALDDDPKAPQFIETVHRRGYRFIAPITTAPAQRGAWGVRRLLPSLSLFALRFPLYDWEVVTRSWRSCTDG